MIAIPDNPVSLCLSLSAGGLSMWYAYPPFRVHNRARRTIELEWENEFYASGSKILTLSINYQPDGKYLIEVPLQWENIVLSLLIFEFRSTCFPLGSST